MTLLDSVIHMLQPPSHAPDAPQGGPHGQQHGQAQGVYLAQEPHQPHPPHCEDQPHHPHTNEDLIHQNDEHYKQLRARANEEGDAMASCFDESHRAYEVGDGARARELSNEGHAHQREMNNLNAQASDWIFQANNSHNKPGEINLHGLYVKEAISHTDLAIQEARSRGDTEIHLIVGKGLHSTEHVAKLEPAIEGLMQKHNLAAHLDEHNSGVLVVALDGRRSDRTLGSVDITRRLERKDEGCVVV